MLSTTEISFARLSKDLGNSSSLSTLNACIEILERPPQAVRQNSAYAALASAHVSDQDYGLPLRRQTTGHNRSVSMDINPQRFGLISQAPFSPLGFLYLFSERFLR
jgi:hypothetical protein